MAGTKHSGTAALGQPLILEPQPPQYIVVLPPHLPHYRRRLLRRSCWQPVICCTAISVLLVAAAYLIWPSDPELSIVRLNLDGLHFHTRPQISLDVTLDTTVKVRNRDFYSIDYNSMLVSIGYRGEQLGYMTSGGGRVRARGSSYVNATLQLDSVEILSNVILLIEDLAKGAITFDTTSEVKGKLGLFFFELPLKTKISCEVIVNTRNQTIVRQNCYL